VEEKSESDVGGIWSLKGLYYILVGYSVDERIRFHKPIFIWIKLVGFLCSIGSMITSNRFASHQNVD